MPAARVPDRRPARLHAALALPPRSRDHRAVLGSTAYEPRPPTPTLRSRPVSPELIAAVVVDVTMIGLLLAFWRDSRACSRETLAELRTEIRAFRAEIRADIQAWRAERRARNQALRADVRAATKPCARTSAPITGPCARTCRP